jgi:hypothetical protein
MMNELAVIEQTMRNDPEAYWGNEGMRDRYLTLLAEREEPAATDWQGDRTAALRTVAEVRRDLELTDSWSDFEAAFDALPETVHRAVETDLLAGPEGYVRPAPPQAIADWRSPAGRALVKEWGPHAPEAVARATRRFWRIADMLSDDDFAAACDWFGRLPDDEAKIVMKALARR